MMTSVSRPQHVFGKSGFLQNTTERPQGSTLRKNGRETCAPGRLGVAGWVRGRGAVLSGRTRVGAGSGDCR